MLDRKQFEDANMGISSSDEEEEIAVNANQAPPTEAANFAKPRNQITDKPTFESLKFHVSQPRHG